MQAQGSPLVQGAVRDTAQVRMRVLRAFLLGGQRQEVGTEVLVPRSLAAELLYQRRAERLADPEPPAAPARKSTPRAPRRAQEKTDAA